MAGQIKVDSINADSNLTLKIANTAVAFIDATGLRPTSGNVNLDATATSKLYLPSANTVAIQTASVTAVTVDSSQNVTLAAALAVTGVTTVQAGTAALPAITTDGDTNTGIFFPAADTIAFSEGGAESMRIDSSGNVGIGTTSPGSKLYTQLSSATAYSSGVTGNGLTIYNSSATTGQYVGITLQGEPTTGNGGLATIMGTTTGSGNMDLTFSTRGSATLAERMRINSNGNLLVGTTTQTATPAQGVILGGADSSSGVYIGHANGTSSGNYYMAFSYNGSAIGSITQNGTTNVAYNTSSDYRLKENIQPMQNALATISQLKPVTYKWKTDGSDGQGFIAHELQAVVPDCVTGDKDAVETYTDEDGNEQTRPKYQGIDTSFLVATLTAAIQELKAINDTQAETINALTANLTALTARITALESTP